MMMAENKKELRDLSSTTCFDLRKKKKFSRHLTMSPGGFAPVPFQCYLILANLPGRQDCSAHICLLNLSGNLFVSLCQQSEEKLVFHLK
jgi:hypothetical protein